MPAFDVTYEEAPVNHPPPPRGELQWVRTRKEVNAKDRPDAYRRAYGYYFSDPRIHVTVVPDESGSSLGFTPAELEVVRRGGTPLEREEDASPPKEGTTEVRIISVTPRASTAPRA
jgi:hypothetical protein